MFKLFRNPIIFRTSANQACSCSTNSKEKGAKTPMPTNLTKLTDVSSKAEISKRIRKEDMQWRTPWHQTEGQYYSMLRTFYTEDNQSSLLKFIQQPVDFRPSTIKKWWAKRKEFRAIALQQYIPQRNETLGNELAAAHFIVHRGGAVKFFGEEKWIKANKYNEYELPVHYQEDKVLQAIDCRDVELYYEGLINFRNLRQLEWFSVNGCEQLDDWALDRISSQFMNTLLYLDIRNCPRITPRGLTALYKMDKLKILYIDDVTASNEWEMLCLLLQDVNPALDIRET